MVAGHAVTLYPEGKISAISSKGAFRKRYIILYVFLGKQGIARSNFTQQGNKVDF